MQTFPRTLADNGATMAAPNSPLSQNASMQVDASFAKSPLGLQLQEVLLSGKGSNTLIADFLLRNPVRSTAYGIEELAAHTHTSTATWSRFARALGYEGFAALRAALAEALQQAFQPAFQPVEKLRGALERSPSQGARPVLAESMQVTVANLSATAAALDTTRLNAIAKHVQGAKIVYTMGFGISAHLAAMLALDLQPFCKQCINVVDFGGTEVAAGRLMNIGPKDLLIAISFPRYARDAVTLTRYARDRGARILALTDSVASPLVPWSHDVLLAGAAHPVLSSSYSAAVMVAEALVTSLMLSGGSHVTQAEKLTYAISSYLYKVLPASDGIRASKASKS
jgi:DNA-binding MurR/RpiR family transcriptional regulator